jgi:hypothetical protein
MGESMPVTIVNRSTSRPLLVPLSNGKTLRLPPGGSSGKLPDREAENNPKVDKLRRQGLLDVLTEPRSGSRKKDAPETSGKE